MKLRMLVLIIIGLIISSCIFGSVESTRAATSLTGLPSSGKYNYVSMADVNKDGYLDIIVGAGGYPGDSPGGLYVYLNQNGNSFKSSSSGLPGEGKSYFGSVQVIDIDGDSNLDLIGAYESRWSRGDDNGIGIWLGNGGSGGTMKWTAATSPVSTGSYDSAHCADIDNDGKLDLVAGSSSGLYVWKGSHSPGSLAWKDASSGLPTSNEYTGVWLGDVNNDQRLDIAAGSYSSQGVSVFLCSVSGTLSWSDGDTDTSLIQTGNSFDMRIVDLNDDTNMDIIASIRGGIRAYLGNGNSGGKDTWWTEISTGLPTSSDYYQLAIADLDNDGKTDIGCSYKVWSNSGNMADSTSYSWEELELGISDSSSIGFAIGELDNDGHLDIAGCGWDIGVKAYALELGNPGDPPDDPPKDPPTDPPDNGENEGSESDKDEDSAPFMEVPILVIAFMAALFIATKFQSRRRKL